MKERIAVLPGMGPGVIGAVHLLKFQLIMYKAVSSPTQMI